MYFFELLSQLFDANMHGLSKQVQQVNHLLHRRKKMTTCATGATGESPVAQEKTNDSLCNRCNR